MNPLSIRPERLERLRKICLALPEATEKEAWGDPTWRVHSRIFAMQKGNYAEGRPSVWLKAADDAQPLLVKADPGCFFVPPYVGHNGWVGVHLDTRRVDWPMLSNLIEESYRMIAPKRRPTRARTSSAKPPAAKPPAATAAGAKTRANKARGGRPKG